MPFVSFDDDVSGSGSAALSSSPVLFITIDLTTLGPIPRAVDDDDHVLRAGWVALADTFDIGLGTFLYSQAPIYADFVHTLWTPKPSLIGSSGDFLTAIAPYLRWHFAVGVEAHIHVLNA